MKKILGGDWEFIKNVDRSIEIVWNSQKFLKGLLWVVQINNINRFLLSIYVESVLKVFKRFNSLRVYSLGVVYWCFIISYRQVQFR